MTGISDYMSKHHKQCDDVFVRAEEAAGASDWAAAEREFGAFLSEMERHFRLEEELLFPKFEAKTGMAFGPTQVMRMEHEQMRNTFEQLRLAIEAKDSEQFLGMSETLLILMQQHNMKEEGVIYAMLDEMLGEEVDSVLAQLESAAA